MGDTVGGKKQTGKRRETEARRSEPDKDGKRQRENEIRDDSRRLVRLATRPREDEILSDVWSEEMKEN